jgi:hypothetical protein
MFSKIPREVLLLAGFVITGIVSVVATIFILANFQDRIPGQQLKTSSEVAAEVQPQTEQIFLNGISSLPDKSGEWWAVRADHRLLAQAIFNCVSPDSPIASVPRHYYRSLLLDLTPSGDHAFAASSTEVASLAALEKTSPAALKLGNNEEKLLALSDSIARARIAAAYGASVNVPWVQRLGFATVVISALATLFVTLQGRMRPVDLDDGKREEYEQSPFFKRVRYSLGGAGSGFRWVAFFAIALSITGTALTGLKQVYDPSRTLTQNTRSLLQLRQLHQDVVLSTECTDQAVSEPAQMKSWIKKLRELRFAVLPEYGAYAALDVSNNSGSSSESRTEDSGAAAPAAEAEKHAAPPAKQEPSKNR